LPDVPLDKTSGEETVLLEWTVHLLRREPSRAPFVLVAMLFSALLGVCLFRSPVFALLGPVLLLSATAEYLLPIHYRLTDRRACASYGAARLEISWDRVKRRDLGAAMTKLSPFAAPNRLDSFRGVALRFGRPGEPGDRDEVLRIVGERIATSRSASADPAGTVRTGALT
jgi:hypothetical protein